MTKSRGILGPRVVWTPAELELLSRNFHDTLSRDLATACGKKLSQVNGKAHRIGLKKDIEHIRQVARERSLDPSHPMHKTGFQKGQVPANKGLRRPGWSPGNMARTQFKKGQLPHTTMPVGSHRLNGDGYVELKFAEVPGPWSNRWEALHVRVWKQAHGAVPKDYVVCFKPGRRTTVPSDITLDAIECISRVELMARNTIHNLPAPLKQVVQLRGALNRQINKRIGEST
jgi:hypothetical protein